TVLIGSRLPNWTAHYEVYSGIGDCASMHAVRKRRRLTIRHYGDFDQLAAHALASLLRRALTDPPHRAHVALSVFRERVYMLNTAPSRPATAKQGDLDRRIESSSNRSSVSSS